MIIALIAATRASGDNSNNEWGFMPYAVVAITTIATLVDIAVEDQMDERFLLSASMWLFSIGAYAYMVYSRYENGATDDKNKKKNENLNKGSKALWKLSANSWVPVTIKGRDENKYIVSRTTGDQSVRIVEKNQLRSV